MDVSIAAAEEIVLIADPRVVAIPIVENHEPLFNIKDQTEILFGPSPEVENNTCYTYMRVSVFEKLKKAQKLLPSSVRLCLYEGLRTLSLQQYLFDQRWIQVQQSLRLSASRTANSIDSPDYDSPGYKEEIFHEVIKMVSPVTLLDGSHNIPPHSTGAAVDVYLVDSETLAPIEMGILAKDWMLDVEGKVSQSFSDLISPVAKRNRQLMFDVMSQVGFVNYPTEYWHWSYGDRYWAFIKNQNKAIYGPVVDSNI